MWLPWKETSSSKLVKKSYFHWDEFWNRLNVCLKHKLKAREHVIDQRLIGENTMLVAWSTNSRNCSRLGKETKRLSGVL